MRYFIAHLVEGGAKRYRDRVVRELHRKYQITSPKLSLPAHLTLKPPFECNLMQITQVEKSLRTFLRTQTAPHYHFRGFGRFGFKTIYVDVVKSPDASRLMRECIRYLNHKNPWLPRTHIEGNKLHMSVARHLDRKTSAKIWRELKALLPESTGRLDSVSVLKYDKKRWVVRTTIRIPRTARLPLWDT